MSNVWETGDKKDQEENVASYHPGPVAPRHSRRSLIGIEESQLKSLRTCFSSARLMTRFAPPSPRYFHFPSVTETPKIPDSRFCFWSSTSSRFQRPAPPPPTSSLSKSLSSSKSARPLRTNLSLLSLSSASKNDHFIKTKINLRKKKKILKKFLKV